MTAPGQLVYGGDGTVTGAANVALRSLNADVRFQAANGVAVAWGQTAGGADARGLIDGVVGTEVIGGDPPAGSAWQVDLGAPKRIGFFRVYNGATANRKATSINIQSSDDLVSWVDRDTSVRATFDDTGVVALAATTTARYWRVLINSTVAWASSLREILLYAVTTVGAGNQVALPPPAERRVLGFEPSSGVPAWQARQAAEADLAAGTAGAPAAYVGVDVAAVGPAQVALLSELNDLRTVVVALRVDRDAALTKVNALITKLEAAAVLAP